MALDPTFAEAEHLVSRLVMWLRLAVETAGALSIAIGIVLPVYRFVRSLSADDPERFTTMRIALARYLALALEFQLAADVLSTAIAPRWDELGKLAATAAIRTALNYFLSREARELAARSPHGVATEPAAAR